MARHRWPDRHHGWSSDAAPATTEYHGPIIGELQGTGGAYGRQCGGEYEQSFWPYWGEYTCSAVEWERVSPSSMSPFSECATWRGDAVRSIREILLTPSRDPFWSRSYFLTWRYFSVSRTLVTATATRIEIIAYIYFLFYFIFFFRLFFLSYTWISLGRQHTYGFLWWLRDGFCTIICVICVVVSRNPLPSKTIQSFVTEWFFLDLNSWAIHLRWHRLTRVPGMRTERVEAYNSSRLL